MSTYIPGLKLPDTPTQYRAIGFLHAKYLPSAENFLRGTLVTDDGLFPAALNHALAKWLKKNPTQLSTSYIWLVYPRKLKESPGLTFSAYSIVEIEQSVANYFSIRGQLWGWDEEKGKLVIKIKRNEEPPPRLKGTKLWKPFYLEIQGRLPVSKERGQFWELKCFRDGESLLLGDGRMVKNADEMKAIVDRKPDSGEDETSEKTQEAVPRTGGSMTEARAEITLKFNTIPEVRTVPSGRVSFDLVAPNGVVFTVNIKGKSWRKASENMQQFSNWVAAGGGKLGNPTPSGFEVADASLSFA